MKKVSIILISMVSSIILFNSCDLDTTDQFDKVDKRDTLTSSRWYYIDKNADEYTVANFTDNSVNQDFYTDAGFREIAYTKHYTIDYSGDTIYLTDEYGKHTCKYNSCQNDDWMTITCDADQPYIMGWRTRALAAENAAR